MSEIDWQHLSVKFKQPLSLMVHLVLGKWTMREFRPSEGSLSRLSRVQESYTCTCNTQSGSKRVG